MTVPLGHGVELIRRSELGMRAPRSRTPVTASFGVTAHWEGPTMGAFPHTSCPAKWRGIQSFHMDQRGWSDIAYTAGICPHGYVLEGRWAGVRTAANGTNDGNNRALALCYLGGIGDPFPEAAALAMYVAAEWLTDHGGAGTGRNGHRDWKSTECPGDTIYSWLQAGRPVTITPGDTDMTTPAEVRTIVREELAAFATQIMGAVSLGRPILVKGDGNPADKPEDMPAEEWASRSARWYVLDGGDLEYVPSRESAEHHVAVGVRPAGFNSAGPFPHVWRQGLVESMLAAQHVDGD